MTAIDLRIHAWDSALPDHVALTDNAVDIWWIDLDASAHDVKGLSSLLDPAETARVGRLRRENVRRRFAIRRGALRRLLSAYLGCDARAVTYAATPLGKLELTPTGAAPRLYFNLSHAAACAVYAVTRLGAVGVDVERAVPFSNMRGVVQAVFSKTEQAALAQLSDEQQVTGFYNGWTRKEAVVKALGQGITYPLNSFSVSLHPDTPAQLLSAQDEQLYPLTLVSVPLPSPLIAACAVYTG